MPTVDNNGAFPFGGDAQFAARDPAAELGTLAIALEKAVFNLEARYVGGGVVASGDEFHEREAARYEIREQAIAVEEDAGLGHSARPCCSGSTRSANSVAGVYGRERRSAAFSAVA